MAACARRAVRQRFLLRLRHGAQRARQYPAGGKSRPRCGSLPVGHEMRLRSRPQLEETRGCAAMDCGAHFVDGDIRRRAQSPARSPPGRTWFRIRAAPAAPASTMPGTSAGISPATGMIPFSPSRLVLPRPRLAGLQRARCGTSPPSRASAWCRRPRWHGPCRPWCGSESALRRPCRSAKAR